MNKEKLDKLIPNLQPIFQVKKKQNKKNGCISIYYTFKNIFPKCYTYKNTVLQEISSKWARKAFLVKIENKMLLQTIWIL